MADYPAQGSRNYVGTQLTKRTGTAAADRVPVGTTVVFNNTGAGAHTVTFTNTGTYGGLAISNRSLGPIAAGGMAFITIDPAWDGAGAGYVTVNIDGTAAEVTYAVLGM